MKGYIMLGFFLVAVVLLFYSAGSPTGFATYSESAVDFSAEQQTVNDYFYGVNTHGIWGAEDSWVDADGDGIREAASDYEWHREKLLGANINYLRADMGLEWITNAPPENDAESWDTTTAYFENVESSQTVNNVPLTWGVESVRGSGTVTRSLDAHSGSYAIRIDNTGSSGSVFSKRNVGVLAPGNTYIFSAWVKANGTIKLHVQRMDTWTAGCSAMHSGDETWQYLTCEFTPTEEIAEGWRLIIETRPNTWLLWDDASFTKNGQSFYPTFNNALVRQRSLVKWAYENDVKVEYIASYMPIFLADTSAGCANRPDRCPPVNSQAYADLVVDFVDIVTEHGRYADAVEIEVWNEPDLQSFFMPDVDKNDLVRTQRYNEMYAAVYGAMTAAYPGIPVGGSGTSSVTTSNGRLIHTSWLDANARNQDFVSFHTYTNGDADKQIVPMLEQVDTDCDAAGATCDRILLDEWNVYRSDVKTDDPAEFSKQLALAYAGTLNYDAQRVQMVMYQWSESKKYQDGINYPEYPQRWSMVSEPQLDNELYASYYVTKDFSTFHPAGARIVTSESANADVRIVASITPPGVSAEKGSLNNDPSEPVYHVTLINGGAAQSFPLHVLGLDVAQARDAKTGASLPVQDGVVTVALAQSQVVHLELTPAVDAPIAPDAPAVIDTTIVLGEPANDALTGNETNETNETVVLPVQVATGSSGGGGGGGGGALPKTVVPVQQEAAPVVPTQEQTLAVEQPKEQAQEQPQEIIDEYYVEDTHPYSEARKTNRLLAPFTGSKEFLVLVTLLASLFIVMSMARWKH